MNGRKVDLKWSISFRIINSICDCRSLELHKLREEELMSKMSCVIQLHSIRFSCWSIFSSSESLDVFLIHFLIGNCLSIPEHNLEEYGNISGDPPLFAHASTSFPSLSSFTKETNKSISNRKKWPECLDRSIVVVVFLLQRVIKQSTRHSFMEYLQCQRVRRNYAKWNERKSPATEYMLAVPQAAACIYCANCGRQQDNNRLNDGATYR